MVQKTAREERGGAGCEHTEEPRALHPTVAPAGQTSDSEEARSTQEIRGWGRRQDPPWWPAATAWPARTWWEGADSVVRVDATVSVGEVVSSIGANIDGKPALRKRARFADAVSPPTHSLGAVGPRAGSDLADDR